MTVSQQQSASRADELEDKIRAGEHLFHDGDTQGAIAAFREVLDIDPTNTTAHGNLGVVFWQAGTLDEALYHLTAAHHADPDDDIVIANLAEAYAATGQFDEITRICSPYLATHPEATGMRARLTQLLAGAASGSTVPEDNLESGLIERAEGLLADDETEKGLAVLHAVIALSRRSTQLVHAHRLLSAGYRQRGNTTTAIHHLMEAFRLDSHDRDTALTLARLLQDTQRHDTAEHVLATFLYLHPDDVQAETLLQTSREHVETHRRATAAGARATPGADQDGAGVSALTERIPEMNNTLRALLELGVEIRSILDVGVLHGTPALMQNFPALKHYLFEPIDDHFDIIEHNYARLDHELHHIALSNADGAAWQNGLCNNASGKITHSQISDQPLTCEQEPRLLVSKPVRKARLDSLVPGLGAAAPYLLKIDVDGHEIPILEGAVETLKNASVVVIEATRDSVLSRAQLLARHDFRLFDIVDFAYYAGVLHQVDLIFVGQDICADNAAFNLMQTQPFDPDQWYPLSYRCFGR